MSLSLGPADSTVKPQIYLSAFTSGENLPELHNRNTASYLADYPYLTRNIADPPPENGQASAELGFNYAARTNGWVGDRIGEHLT